MIYIALEQERFKYNGSRYRNINKVIQKLLETLKIQKMDDIVNDQLFEHITRANCSNLPKIDWEKEVKNIPYA